MTVQELIMKAYAEATGKYKVLEQGSKKYDLLLNIDNIMQSQWEREANVTWYSRQEEVEAGEIYPGDFRYELPREVISVNVDYPVVLVGRSKWAFTPVPTPELRHNPHGVAIEGKYLNFGGGLTPPMMGATILVQATVELPRLVNPEDEVKIDDPQWLVFMTAAEYVRNLVTRQHQYSNLVALAQNSMEQMKSRNQLYDKSRLTVRRADWI